MRNIKCPVCGNRFVPRSADRYTAREPAAPALLPKPPAEFDAFDCPQCGRQILVGVRIPESGSTLPEVKGFRCEDSP